MEKIVNNTEEVKHLTHGDAILYPGENELPAETIDRNYEHPGFKADVEAGRIESPYFEKKKGHYPVKISDNGWYELSNGERVLGHKQAKEAQAELDAKDEENEDEENEEDEKETGGE